MGLIEQRHPQLGRLLQEWRSHCDGDRPAMASAMVGETFAHVPPSAVLLTRTDDGAGEMMIAASGAEVDDLYGEPLTGAPVERLTPEGGDVVGEARSAIDTARPVVIEETLQIGERRRRVARLYLPLANEDGTVDGVLCGVVAVA